HSYRPAFPTRRSSELWWWTWPVTRTWRTPPRGWSLVVRTPRRWARPCPASRFGPRRDDDGREHGSPVRPGRMDSTGDRAGHRVAASLDRGGPGPRGVVGADRGHRGERLPGGARRRRAGRPALVRAGAARGRRAAGAGPRGGAGRGGGAGGRRRRDRHLA